MARLVRTRLRLPGPLIFPKGHLWLGCFGGCPMLVQRAGKYGWIQPSEVIEHEKALLWGRKSHCLSFIEFPDFILFGKVHVSGKQQVSTTFWPIHSISSRFGALALGALTRKQKKPCTSDRILRSTRAPEPSLALLGHAPDAPLFG